MLAAQHTARTYKRRHGSESWSMVMLAWWSSMHVWCERGLVQIGRPLLLWRWSASSQLAELSLGAGVADKQATKNSGTYDNNTQTNRMDVNYSH